ncbi:hypothetical protein Prudu_018955 [Prunus dulcis]|uniref:Uncharacterized protein n=1 Tax=Prunus dulcis TaxID=3755 RepID=A0A4Y1RTI9_PRUDU|nr:hypothetical protein Prudu_018955 [Prunus dulcis]
MYVGGIGVVVRNSACDFVAGDRKIAKINRHLIAMNRNRGKPNRIFGMKNRTAFAVAVAPLYNKITYLIALVLKQHDRVLQIYSPPPTLEFVTLVVNA